MKELANHPDAWPSEAQMPTGPGLPDQPLQLWDADGWSHASVVICPGRQHADEGVGSTLSARASSA
jgi:hypothetical protein